MPALAVKASEPGFHVFVLSWLRGFVAHTTGHDSCLRVFAAMTGVRVS